MIGLYNKSELLRIAKRLRYKTIESINYYYFILNGYRVEVLLEKDMDLVCVVKGGSPRKTNNDTAFTDNIIYIKELRTKDYILYNEPLYKRFVMAFSDYLDSVRWKRGRRK